MNMASDAHVHPFELASIQAEQETVRRSLGITALSSAWRGEELVYCRKLARSARADGAAPFWVGFGVHPQLLLEGAGAAGDSLSRLRSALEEGGLDALGEAGLDAYGPHRATLDRQLPLFIQQLELARAYRLPLVLHLRKAQGLLFSLVRELKALPALIVHASPLSLRESLSILDRGVNAFFSFGTPLLKGKKSALEAVAGLPPDRILLETDAPYQGEARGSMSDWTALARVRRKAFELRKGEMDTEGAFERLVDNNLRRALGHE